MKIGILFMFLICLTSTYHLNKHTDFVLEGRKYRDDKHCCGNHGGEICGFFISRQCCKRNQCSFGFTGHKCKD